MNDEARAEEAVRFAKDSSPHLESLKELAEKVGASIDTRSNPVTKKRYILISGDGIPFLDGIRIEFTYEAYRLINAALQGQAWYNELTEKIHTGCQLNKV